MGEPLDDRPVVIDVHTHAVGFVPQPFRSLYRLVNRTTMPADEGFDVLRAAGVDAVVAKAVGDPVVTRWYRGGAWKAVERQLASAAAQIEAAGGVVARTPDDVRNAQAAGRPAAILGVEGADALGEDDEAVDRVGQWHQRGVRVVVLVHLGDNQFGTTCMPWQDYVGPLPKRRRRQLGLSALGRRVVERMQQLGIVVDVSHADRQTTFDIVEQSTRPVIASHSGARARADFPRFLTDDEIRAVAGTGGLIGLWPYNHRGKGVRDMDDLIGHARYVADLVGPQHLCIGTDMNGVPGLMAGYRGEADLPRVTDALRRQFGDDDVRGILGANFLRIWSP
ncbi:MAG: membrane dipeptidase [Actinobacteria bacterium]|nr:membrane dipeptidase [Actinomycetota bacterium]